MRRHLAARPGRPTGLGAPRGSLVLGRGGPRARRGVQAPREHRRPPLHGPERPPGRRLHLRPRGPRATTTKRGLRRRRPLSEARTQGRGAAAARATPDPKQPDPPRRAHSPSWNFGFGSCLGAIYKQFAAAPRAFPRLASPRLAATPPRAASASPAPQPRRASPEPPDATAPAPARPPTSPPSRLPPPRRRSPRAPPGPPPPRLFCACAAPPRGLVTWEERSEAGGGVG